MRLFVIIAAAIYVALGLLFPGPLIRTFWSIFCLLAFYFVDFRFRMHFKLVHYILFSIIVLAGLILSPLYFFIPWYDKILHFLMPILGAVIIFHIINGLKINLGWKLFITFSIGIAFSGLLEIGEYLLDLFFSLELQGVYLRDAAGITYSLQAGLTDTMQDMILALFGNFIFLIYKLIKN